MINDCVFCRELKGSRDTNFAERYPEIQSRVIFETESLAAFPCIGQLVYGHFLIVPKNHDCTLAQTIKRLSNLNQELMHILNEVHLILGCDLEKSLFFEHGALGPNDGSCGIYHAHLHVLPSTNNIDPVKLHNFKKNKPLKTIEAVLKNTPIDKPYIFVGNFKDGFYQSLLEEPLPSQTLRKAVANQLNINNWDWRKIGQEENMVSILKQVELA
ncbi:HIT domain-containing protein [Acinetobacter sp. AYS6]|uniref:HIT family protein n=1 Tax=Acinetobacter sp. AYS6 TaxID=2983297 RepID=UPI0021D69C16|nr:HIT domain-containing protein [Acinetobacter sp. AYS6]MCU7698778.1 HIT domain-containing protein [Acinetobacter sp. AYS6]